MEVDPQIEKQLFNQKLGKRTYAKIWGDHACLQGSITLTVIKASERSIKSITPLDCFIIDHNNHQTGNKFPIIDLILMVMILNNHQKWNTCQKVPLSSVCAGKGFSDLISSRRNGQQVVSPWRNLLGLRSVRLGMGWDGMHVRDVTG